MTFKGFIDSKRSLEYSQFFEMLEGKKYKVLLPESGKKSFDNGITIPTEMSFCNECKDKRMIGKYNNQVNENKEFEVIQIFQNENLLFNLVIYFLIISS